MQRFESSDVITRAFIFVAGSSLLFLSLAVSRQATVENQSLNRLDAQTAKESLGMSAGLLIDIR